MDSFPNLFIPAQCASKPFHLLTFQSPSSTIYTSELPFLFPFLPLSLFPLFLLPAFLPPPPFVSFSRKSVDLFRKLNLALSKLFHN